MLRLLFPADSKPRSLLIALIGTVPSALTFGFSDYVASWRPNRGLGGAGGGFRIYFWISDHGPWRLFRTGTLSGTSFPGRAMNAGAGATRR